MCCFRSQLKGHKNRIQRMTHSRQHDIGASPVRSIVNWLADVPISDPVDRRNAPMLQLLLLVLGGVPPILWLYRGVAVDIPWRPGELASMVTSLCICALAFFSVLLIRRGRLQWAIRQLLVMIALAMLVTAFKTGFAASRFEEPLHAVWLVVAGLVVNRRALWLMYGWIVLVFTVGVWTDLRAVPAEFIPAIIDGFISASIFLLIAIVVDRSTAALRESLTSATLRTAQLSEANRRLEDEIAERERMREQLIHAQKVEAVGRLSAGVAHDFNHLLALVTGYAEQGRSVAATTEANRAFENILAVSQRAAAVTRKLLHFSRREQTCITVFDACAAIRDIEPMVRQIMSGTIALHLDLADVPCMVEFDRPSFDLIALNIASNASLAMDGQGTFTIGVRRDGDKVKLTFADTGHGMSSDTVEKIYEPFFTTRPSHQGTGIGLTVAADLINAAGGTIDVSSTPGAGACFAISLRSSEYADTMPSKQPEQLLQSRAVRDTRY